MSEPIDHHYNPVFYLSRWAGGDGCICRFSRPYGSEVKAKRINPKGTGFEPHLYGEMERAFMARLDSKAADALNLLERGLPDNEWTATARSAWSRFIMAQMLRTPEDIAQLKSSVRHEFEASDAIKAMAEGAEVTPSEMHDYVEQRRDKLPYEVARMLIDHEGIGERLKHMHWLVLDVGSDIPLLTSDRPVWMTATFSEEDALVWMPIGPTKLFTATVSLATQQRFCARSRRGIAKTINKLVVQHAVKCVYAKSDGPLRFVQKHFATKRHSSWLERLAAYRGHAIVGSDSPSREM